MPRIANEELACDQDQGSLVGLCMEDYNKSLRAAVITICATDTHTHTDSILTVTIIITVIMHMQQCAYYTTKIYTNTNTNLFAIKIKCTIYQFIKIHFTWLDRQATASHLCLPIKTKPKRTIKTNCSLHTNT